MNAAHRKRRCDDVSGVAPVGMAIALDQWARQYGWLDRDAEEGKIRAECDQYEAMIEKTRAECDRYYDDRRKWLTVPKWLTEELSRAEGELKRLKVEHKDHMRTLVRLKAPIAGGTSCPGHVLVPWAHSPIWSRQDPIFVSLTQIASYKR